VSCVFSTHRCFDGCAIDTETPMITQKRVGLMDGTDFILYVVDDEPAARAGIAALAASMGLVSETYSSGEEFLEHFAPARSGCAVIDLRLEAMDGIELQKRLLGMGCELPVIFVSAFMNLPNTVQAMQNGAVTVLEKPCQPDQLMAAIRTALSICRKRLEAALKKAVLQARFESLSEREREVMSMILRGMPNKNIANRLGISQRTMNRLRAEIFEKMGTESAVGLAQVAVQLETSACHAG
jgi:two-component system, LuxR family, response regulator FixJ